MTTPDDHRFCNQTPGVKVVELIRTEFNRGKGTADDPVRRVFGYYTLDGHLVAEFDIHTSPPHVEGKYLA